MSNEFHINAPEAIVTFNANYDGGTVQKFGVKKGTLSTTLSVIPEPTRGDGYVFDCWCTDISYSEEVTLSSQVSEDVTFYAKWRRPGYVIDGPSINAIFNKSMLEFREASSVPDSSQTVFDISECNDGSVLTWYDSSDDKQYWWSEIGKIVLHPNSNRFFEGCAYLMEVDFTNFDFSHVNNLCYFMDGCVLLSEVDLSSADTSQLEFIDYMFRGCSSLTDVKLGDMYNTKVALGMFKDCTSLENLDLSNLDWSSMETISELAQGCTNLKSFKLPASLPKLNNMSNMLCGCSSIQSVDLSYVNAPLVSVISYMFFECRALTSFKLPQFGKGTLTDMRGLCRVCPFEVVDLSGVDMSMVMDVGALLDECYWLREIYLGENTLSAVTVSGEMVDGVGLHAATAKCVIYCTPQAQAVIESSALFNPAYITFVNSTNTASLQLYANGGVFEDGTSQMIITD